MQRIVLSLLFFLSWSILATAQSTFKVYTYNVQHGSGTDNSFNPSRQITMLSDADLIGVQERTTGETGWDGPMATAGFAQAVYRQNDAQQGDGPAIWYKSSVVSIVQVYQTDLQTTNLIGWDGSTTVNKAAVGAKVTIAGKTFYFFVTHLCWSACADSSGSQFSAQREGQINVLNTWINGIVGSDPNVILVMDGNFAPDYPKNGGGLIKSMLTNTYTDMWNDGLSNSKATVSWGDRDSNGTADMPLGDLTSRTHDSRRIDYIFLRTGATKLTLNAITIPDTRANCPHSLVAGGALPSCSPEVVGGPNVSGQQWDIQEDFGVRPSDHNPVKATFNLVSSGATAAISCPTTTFVGEVVVCDGSSSTGVNGQLGWSTVDFADGTAPVDMNFGDNRGTYSHSTLLKGPHVYLAAGTFTVTLTVKDSTGAPSSITTSITVTDIPTASAPNITTLTDQGNNTDNCTALNNAITNAFLGNTVEKEIRLPAIAYPCTLTWPSYTGTKYVTIRPTVITWLPGPLVRVTPALSSNMPKIQAPGVDQTPITIGGANRGYIRFLGIEFNRPFSGHLYQFLQIGSSPSTYADLPTNIIIDRCYLHGNTLDNTQRAIFANANKFSLINSYLKDFHTEGEESQGMAGFAGAGFGVVNNYIEAYTQHAFWGGADSGIKFSTTASAGGTSTSATLASVTGLRVGDGISFVVGGTRGPWSATIIRSMSGNNVTFDPITNQAGTPAGPDTTTNAVKYGASPQDILVARNYGWRNFFYKCTDNPNPALPCIPDAAYNGSYRPVVKNLLELKHGMRAIYVGNVLQNHWGGQGQGGPSILFTVRNQTCYSACTSQDNPWAMVRDVSFNDNKVLNIADYINVLGTDNFNLTGSDESGPSAFVQYIRASNNMVVTNASGQNGGGAALFVFPGARHVTFNHHTVVDANSGGYIVGSTDAPVGTSSADVKIVNSIYKHLLYGYIGDGLLGCDFMAHFFPDGISKYNVMSDEDGTISGEPWSCSQVTPQYYPATINTNTFIDLTDCLAGGSCRLKSTSPYKAGNATPAADGTDIGVNMDTVAEATLNTIAGDWTGSAGTVTKCNWHGNPRCVAQ